MVCESGLTLLFNEKDIKVGGGFHTTASCLNQYLLDRLIKTGSTFITE